jgi:NTP pyrophosphatase (non-canonical NTP hydrolase)
MSDIRDLTERLQSFAAARGWEQYHRPKNLLMALTGEIGELAAELQWLSEAEAEPEAWDDDLRRRVSGEVADVLIYLVRFADVCGIDAVGEAHDKITRNEERFPVRPT